MADWKTIATGLGGGVVSGRAVISFSGPAADGSFTPDLSTGASFRMVLTADGLVNGPVNWSATALTAWSLEIDQDSVGGHSAVLNAAYNCAYVLASPASLPNTRSVISLITDQAGKTYPAGSPSTNQPIPS